MKMQQTRDKALDYSKGLGALLVIWGHMTTYPRSIRGGGIFFPYAAVFLCIGLAV